MFPAQTITFDAALRDVASGSPKARAHAAHALGDVTDQTERRRAIDALIRALDDDRFEVRAEACSSLGQLGELGVAPHLIKRLADGAPAVRQNAAVALGTLRAPDGFEALADALRGGPPDLRFQAATSLAEIDPPRAFDLEIAALADGDPQVVGAAALSIGAIAAEYPEAKLAERAREALAPRLAHADAGARFDVAYALADVGDARGADVLARATTDEHRAWDAVTALAKLGPAAAAELQEAVEHKKTPLEAQTLAAGRLLAVDPEHARARKVLLAGLAARKVHVRGIAIEQLAQVGRAWALAPLEQFARSSKGADWLAPLDQALRAIAARGSKPA